MSAADFFIKLAQPPLVDGITPLRLASSFDQVSFSRTKNLKLVAPRSFPFFFFFNTTLITRELTTASCFYRITINREKNLSLFPSLTVIVYEFLVEY